MIPRGPIASVSASFVDPGSYTKRSHSFQASLRGRWGIHLDENQKNIGIRKQRSRRWIRLGCDYACEYPRCSETPTSSSDERTFEPGDDPMGNREHLQAVSVSMDGKSQGTRTTAFVIEIGWRQDCRERLKYRIGNGMGEEQTIRWQFGRKDLSIQSTFRI